MNRSWQALLRDPAPSLHAVQVYAHERELASSVAEYLAAGFAADDPAVVVATGEHSAAFAAALCDLGWDAARIEASKLLVLADAEATLAAITVSGRPSARAFEHVVGGLLDRAASLHPGRRVRAFGEMVDLLWQDGRVEAAIELEDLWNAALAQRAFTLLCGYLMDVFDRDAQSGPLPDVCRVHSHVQPARDADRLARAVDWAIDDVLGRTERQRIHGELREQHGAAHVPEAQRALMWVSAHMPALAARVLETARAHYAAA